MYLLTKSVKRELKQVAITLPATFERRSLFRGMHMGGDSANDTKMAKIGDFIMVDHYKKLCYIYKTTGSKEELRKYVRDVHSIKPGAKIGNFPMDLEIILPDAKYISEGDDNDE